MCISGDEQGTKKDIEGPILESWKHSGCMKKSKYLISVHNRAKETQSNKSCNMEKQHFCFSVFFCE